MHDEITVEQTTDETYIKSVFHNPKVYADTRDDKCPEAMPSVDFMGIPGFFLKVLVNSMPAGGFWFIWKNGAVEAHTVLQDNCRGRSAVEAARRAVKWVFSNTNAKAIHSYSWSDAPAVRWFCRMAGMKEGETVLWPNTRNGKQVSLTYYSIQR